MLNNLSQDEIVDGTEQPKIVSFTPIDSYLCSYDDDNIVQYLRNTNMKKNFLIIMPLKKNLLLDLVQAVLTLYNLILSLNIKIIILIKILGIFS